MSSLSVTTASRHGSSEKVASEQDPFRRPLLVLLNPYLKLMVRIISVTWIDASELTPVCVVIQELRFTSSGREDIDVRMLGRGRPFIVEVVNPHYTRFSKDKLTEMQNSINSVVPDKVQVLDLQFCTKKQADFLKKTVEEKRKSYRLVAWFPNPITEDDLKNVDGKTNVVLEQRTPIRVLHRCAV
jgi:tRNA pseudouridine(54/55) synthase